MRALLVPTDQAKPSEYVDVDHHHCAIAARIGAEWIERVRTPAPGIAMLPSTSLISKLLRIQS